MLFDTGVIQRNAGPDREGQTGKPGQEDAFARATEPQQRPETDHDGDAMGNALPYT